MEFFKRIGLALAFSPTAEMMLSEAVRLQRIFHSELVLVHIGHAGEKELQMLQILLARVGLAPDQVTVVWQEGDPAKGILRACRDKSIDLLLAGALKRENIMRYYIGTVARNIMRKADCSVMMITDPSLVERTIRNIVVNAEDSPFVSDALTVACRLAVEGHAWVHVVREIKMYGLAMAATGQHSEDEYGDMRQQLVQDEIDEVERMLARIPHEGVKINIKMLSGKSGFEVSQFAQKKNADLLIFGAPSRRFRLFDRLFPHDLEYIFADMPCNLLIVHPGKGGRHG